MIDRLAGWKGYALATAVALAIGFGAGWTVRDWKAGSDEADGLKEQVRTVERVVYRERAQADATSAVEARAAVEGERIRLVTRTLVKEVPVHVTPDADARCIVPVGFVRIHDAAAAGRPVSEPAREPDAPAGDAPSDRAGPLDAPSQTTLSGVAEAVAENYGSCHGDLNRFRELQAWIRAQQAVMNTP